MTEHMEVASYVLGLLEPAEMSRFEEHLAGCDECASQLESLLPMVSQLADVEPGDLFNVAGPSAFGPPAQSAAARPIITPGQPAAPPPVTPSRRALRSADFPSQGYPAAEQPNPVRDYPNQGYPEPGYAEPGYAEPGYAEPGYQDEDYAEPGYPEPGYAEPGYPEPSYPEAGYPDRGYPTEDYPNQDYPRRGEPAPPGLLPLNGRSSTRPPTRGPATGKIPVRGPSTGEQRTIEPLGQRANPDRKIALSRPPSLRPEAPRTVQPARSARPPGRQNPTMLIAAAAAVIGVVAGGGVIAAGPWFKSDSGNGTAISQSANRLSATDPKTGVHTDVVLDSKSWGTLVSFGVSDIHGPRDCRLVAVRTDGESEVLSTWTVPKQGYGSGTTPQELTLEASTALKKQDIAALRIQEVGKSGGGTNLVTVNT